MGTGKLDVVDGLVLGDLTKFLVNTLGLPSDIDVQATLIAGGRSNPTYRLGVGSRRWVLRRPPYGHVLPTAHDMAREYKVVEALSTTAVPVPGTIYLCEDTEVLGAPFYLMELVDGRQVGTPEQVLDLTVTERRRLGLALADALADLHNIDPSAVGLESFGRPEGYLSRQLQRWAKQWSASTATKLPNVETLIDRLAQSIPESSGTSIVHGDVKLDNVLTAHDDPARIVAILDWEMSTLGDPLADVGIMLGFWDEAELPFNPITKGLATAPGFPTRAEMLHRYADRRGIPVPDIDWFLIFADFKLAVILAGIAARHANGKTVGSGFDDVAGMVEPLLHRALETAARSSISSLRI